MSKFKVGDKVELVSEWPYMSRKDGKDPTTSPHEQGLTTTVKEVDNDGRFMMDCDNTLWHYEYEWKLIKSATPSPKFEIGDKVRFLGTSNYNFGGTVGKANKGDIFTISAVGAGNKPCYNVEGSYMNNDNPNWCNMEENFELISPNKTLITNNMDDDIKKFDKSVLADAEREAVEEIADEQTAIAKARFKELYLRVKQAEDNAALANTDLAELKKSLSGLKAKK